jgi:hypothetical protein
MSFDMAGHQPGGRTPVLLTSRPRTRRCQIIREPSDWRNGTISRSDIAEFLVRQMEDQLRSRSL